MWEGTEAAPSPAGLSVLRNCGPCPGLALTDSSRGSSCLILCSRECVGFLEQSRVSCTLWSPRSTRPLARMPTRTTPLSVLGGGDTRVLWRQRGRPCQEWGTARAPSVGHSRVAGRVCMCKQPLYRDTMLPSLIPTLHCRPPPHTSNQSPERPDLSVICV